MSLTNEWTYILNLTNNQHFYILLKVGSQAVSYYLLYLLESQVFFFSKNYGSYLLQMTPTMINLVLYNKFLDFFLQLMVAVVVAAAVTCQQHTIWMGKFMVFICMWFCDDVTRKNLLTFGKKDKKSSTP